MSRPTAGASAVTVLRECLAGPFPKLRAQALAIVRKELRRHPSVAATCRWMGIPRSAFDRLRADFPEIDAE